MNDYKEYDLYFIVSIRHDKKVKKNKKKYHSYKNVLIINYDKIKQTNNNSIKNIMDYTFNKFDNFIPKELKPNKDDDLIKDDMDKRFKKVNETVELMKNKPFSEVDKFTGIHGHHKNL